MSIGSTKMRAALVHSKEWMERGGVAVMKGKDERISIKAGCIEGLEGRERFGRV